jgi:hypothetical protein
MEGKCIARKGNETRGKAWHGKVRQWSGFYEKNKMNIYYYYS